jgi:hypothetical protein
VVVIGVVKGVRRFLQILKLIANKEFFEYILSFSLCRLKFPLSAELVLYLVSDTYYKQLYLVSDTFYKYQLP